MGIFSKSEVVILKESSDAKEYLKKLEELLPRATGDVKERIEKEIIITKAGIAGEENVLFELKNSNIDMYVLQDIYIETEDGSRSAQIDFVVITKKITFLIECKNLVGEIEIDSKGNFVRTIQYGRKRYKEGIYSPITQNERHLDVLKECKVEGKNILLGAMIRKNFTLFNKSLVVLANPKTILNDRYAKKEVKEQVIRADQLNSTLKKLISESKELPSTKKEMKEMAEQLLKRNKAERKDYSLKYEELMEIMEKEEAEQVKLQTDDKRKSESMKLICPRCQGELVLRTAKKGVTAGKQFYGCSRFPKCRFVMNIENNE